ncbi:MAG: glycosyl hydrolase family 18 protein [Chitinophagales bacterium]
MKKICIMLLTLVLTFGFYPGYIDAGQAVKVKINGQVRNFQPGGMVVQGRVMLPLRFIVEDPAVQGQVAWDSTSQQVTISCNQNNVVFILGQRRVLVNGVEKTIDVAPFAFQDRTYIPLRVFSEALGATVGWKPSEQTAIINFTAKPRVMGYYYYGTPELLDHSSVTDVAFRWLETDGNGSLFYEYWNNSSGAQKRDNALARARQNGIKIHASVALMGWDAAGKAKLHQLLSNPDNRNVLINNLRQHAAQFGYDGINIDLENVPKEDKANFVVFLSDLAAVLHQDNRVLSVAIPARTAKTATWHAGYDYAGIGSAADLVVVMAYDYHFSNPGPSSPTDWFEDVTDYTVSYIPPNKVLMGIGTYGYDWNLANNNRKTLDQNSLDKLIANGAIQRWDSATYTPYIKYWDASGNQHEAWYENQVSLNEKYALALEHNLAGIGFWQMRNAFRDFYTTLGE